MFTCVWFAGLVICLWSPEVEYSFWKTKGEVTKHLPCKNIGNIDLHNKCGPVFKQCFVFSQENQRWDEPKFAWLFILFKPLYFIIIITCICGFRVIVNFIAKQWDKSVNMKSCLNWLHNFVVTYCIKYSVWV